MPPKVPRVPGREKSFAYSRRIQGERQANMFWESRQVNSLSGAGYSPAAMTRSLTLSSVWFAACAWILGNLLHLAVGGLMLLSLFLPHAHPGSRLVTTIASISAAAFGGTGVAVILTGNAARQRKPWARPLIAAASSVLVAFSGLVLICCVSICSDQLTTRSVTYLTHVVLPVFSGAYFAAGLWWLITFTREEVIAEFSSPNQQPGD
jgi:hypothetical protein